jgi:hypothetical protein
MKRNPAGENTMANKPMPSRPHSESNMGKDGGKVTNPREIPNAQGYIGPRIKR